MARPQKHSEETSESPFRDVAVLLAEIGREFHGRGWALGTSGNFSAVISRKPLRLAITPTGVDKGSVAASAIIETGDSTARDGSGAAGQSKRKPKKLPETSSENASAEMLLHLAVVRIRTAGAVFHTHSVWGTVLSEQYAAQGGVTIAGYEMLKGLAGVRTHEHSEWLPILKNSQDMAQLAGTVMRSLKKHPRAHGFLLRGHGLYTWGRDVAEAKRHVEILEFLLEVLGRRLSVPLVGDLRHFESRGRVRKSR